MLITIDKEFNRREGKTWERLVDFLELNEGKRITIELYKPKRSDSQHRYYFFYLNLIEKSTGNDTNDLHELFKRKFLPPRYKTILGQEVKLPASTKELSKTDFGDYLDKICALTLIPLPNPEDAGYILN